LRKICQGVFSLKGRAVAIILKVMALPITFPCGRYCTLNKYQLVFDGISKNRIILISEDKPEKVK
jgi:hypothetical protein